MAILPIAEKQGELAQLGGWQKDMARRRYQKGNLRKRGKRNPVCELQWWTDCINADGTIGRKRESTILGYVSELTRRRARKRAEGHLRPLNLGKVTPLSNLPFRVFIERHFVPNVFPTLKLSTQGRYRRTLDIHLLPAFGDSRLCDIACQNIPGYMDAMVMPFEVHAAKDLDGLTPGATVDFTLVVEKESNYAEHLQLRNYESVEQDPLTARRLELLGQLSYPSSAPVKALTIGQAVPDFTLTDQNRHRVALTQFSGKVVAVNFIYTSCALPNFCFRNSNTFGALQRRFKKKNGSRVSAAHRYVRPSTRSARRSGSLCQDLGSRPCNVALSDWLRTRHRT